jgi:hypothetical protein
MPGLQLGYRLFHLNFPSVGRIPVDTAPAGSYMKPRGSGATPATSIAQQGEPMKKKGKKDEKAPKKGK